MQSLLVSKALLVSHVAILLVATLWAVPLKADPLLLSSGEQVTGEIESISETSLTLLQNGAQQQWPLASIVRYGNLAALAERPVISLTDGSRIVAAPVWSRQGSIQYLQDRWTLVNSTLRNLSLPRNAVQAIRWQSAAAGSQSIDAMTPSDQASDTIWLTTGDKLAGKLLEIAERKLRFEVAGESIEIETTRVAALTLAHSAKPVAAKMAIGLKDGTLLYVNACKLESNLLEIELTNGQTANGRAAAGVCFFQPFGPQVVYLSDLTPINYRHAPYLGIARPMARDANLLGEDLQVGSSRVLKGLAMRTASRAVYRLDGKFTRFEARVGIDQSAGEVPPGGSVVFQVLVARQGSFAPAYESPIVRSGEPPRGVSVDLRGAEAIALLVDYADFGDTQDHADWLEARLIRQRQ